MKAMLLPLMSKGQQPCSVLEDGFERLQVRFECGEVHYQPIVMDGRAFTALSVEGFTSSQEVGDPNLPTFSQLIEAPLYGGCKVLVAEAQYDTIDLASLGWVAPIAPLQPSRSKSDTTQARLVVNEKAYRLDAFTEMPLAQVERVGIARDRNLARLQISPIRYNPVAHQLIVCRQATITVLYDADVHGSQELYKRYHSPLFQTGAKTLNSLYAKSVSTSAPVRYLIVAHSSFRGQLDDFVAWKRRKGFITNIVYTDESAVGSTTTSIQNYLHGQYDGATATLSAPTYLLLVGDVAQIPAFTGVASSSHITDLYYVSWTAGDNIPDCYVGRFSAQDVSQLTPQVDKTLMYEQYTFADPTFLDRAVMVAGVDGGSAGDYGYTHADPAMDYAITNYINGAHGWDTILYFKNNTSIVPSVSHLYVGSSASSNSATVRGCYSMGAGLINYSAHGSATSWGTPQLTVNQIGSMSNTQKFGLMIGNCCLTNKFEENTCFGEALLRRNNYCGAVGYIGGTNSTYWYEDFYWAVGLRNSSSIGPTMSLAYNAANLGAYDKVCHTHGESFSQWAMSQGSLMMAGNMAVESSTSSRKLYYWEIYSLMGDPSVMPYLTQADTIALIFPTSIMQGQGTLSVQAVPYAYVALTDTLTHALIACGMANGTGAVTLTLPSTLPVGTYELAASAQQHRTTFRQLMVMPPDGPYITATLAPAANHVVAGETNYLPLTLTNLGNQPATNIYLHFNTDLLGATVRYDALLFDSIAANGSLTVDSMLVIDVDPTLEDLTSFNLSALMGWDSCSHMVEMPFPMTVYAPLLQVSFPNAPETVRPGASCDLQVRVENHGHATLNTSWLDFNTDNWLATLTPALDSSFTLAVGGYVLRNYTLTTDSLLPLGIMLPLNLHILSPTQPDGDSLMLLVGASSIETFEGNVFHVGGWNNSSTYPWAIVNAGSSRGSYCLKSYNGLGHNNTSQISITRECAVDDSIRFDYSVSSEANYDKFHFYIDGQDLITASGQVAWTHAVFAVSAGTHTFTFAYAKDYSVNRFDDCAWIDHVELPKYGRPYRQVEDSVCAGAPFVLMGNTVDTQVPGTYYALDTTGDTLTLYRYVVLAAEQLDYSVEACDQYEWHGNRYTSSIEVSDTTMAASGCPLMETLHLTVYYSEADTLVATACDSYDWNGNVYAETTMDSVVGTTAYGCDSVNYLMLTINHSTFDTILDSTKLGYYQWNDMYYTASGSYTQYFTTTEGCDSTVTLLLTIIESTEGIDGVDAAGIRVYPNPTNGWVYLSDQVLRVAVYDMVGRCVMEKESCKMLDLTALPAGIYTLYTLTPMGESRLRMVKK